MSTIGFNLFSYCDNNPVNRSDVNGHSWISDRFNDVKNAVGKIAKSVSNTAQKVASTAKNVTTTVKNAVVNTAKKVATTVTNATRSLVTTVSGVARDAVDWTKNKINDITDGVKKAAIKAKEAVVEAWNWTIKKAIPAVGKFFNETVWKKWIVGGVWETFCKDWVWETFCKKGVWQMVIIGAFTKRITNLSIFSDVAALLSPFSVSIETSNINLLINSQTITNKSWFKNTNLFDKFIWKQGGKGVDDPETVGCLLCGANLDLAATGCGYIAIYNSGILLNKYMDLRSIVYWMEQNDGLLLKNAFGTNPLVIKRFLDIIGISCDLYTDLSDFESKKVIDDVYIVCQWNDKDNIMEGAHFYAVEYYNGKLYSYNGYHDCISKDIHPDTQNYTRDYSRGGANTFSELMNHGSKNGSLICGLVLHK